MARAGALLARLCFGITANRRSPWRCRASGRYASTSECQEEREHHQLHVHSNPFATPALCRHHVTYQKRGGGQYIALYDFGI